MNNIDPTLTVKAPYSQGDITVFGVNAGQQCVAMSLCALIHNNIKGINKCNDLVQIREVGNELYSQCTGQAYLMQTELPAVIMSANRITSSLCLTKITSFIIVKATQVIYLIVIQ